MAAKNKFWGKPINAPEHPYVEYEGTPLWRTAKRALADLEQNRDLSLTEWHQYVVGYLCKQLVKKGHVKRHALARVGRKR